MALTVWLWRRPDHFTRISTPGWGAERGGAGEPWSVILFGLDQFKAINNAHGHLMGDRVLRAVAAAARSTLGPGERLGR
ncbi:diguanylate cyclase domain-containing protein [Deinococcus terrestris]|uniref:diguanylate cyclase domain-containing protein n=1 Tax=Deinococcus terrestris TaxID=2651870 RepID=UPI00128D9092|nr:diguanylate cyclase [Deinococcus terrestris]